MGRRFNIGIDVDGVLSNFTWAARDLCKLMFNGKPSDDLVQTGWGFDSLGISKAEENQMWRQIDSIPDWWMTHEKMPHTNLLTRLWDNHRVIFITNRKDGTGRPIEIQTAMWLRENFQIWNPIVIISDNKGPLGLGLKLDYFIDDRPKNVEEMVEESPLTRTYICDASYNQEVQGIPRVKNFNEFAQIILNREELCL